MSAASRRKKAGKAPKRPTVPKIQRATPRPDVLPKAGRQRPTMTALEAKIAEREYRQEQFIRSLMRPDNVRR